MKRPMKARTNLVSRVDPAGAIQWRRGNDIFFFAGEALGWRGLRNDTWFLQALIGFDEGREEGDSDKGYLDALVTVKKALSSSSKHDVRSTPTGGNWLVGRVVASENGNLGLFGVGRRLVTSLDGSGSEVNLVVVYHDSEFANKDFGITAQQAAASGLAETRMSSGIRSVGVNYNYRHNH